MTKIMDPILQEAIRRLSGVTNITAGLSHPLDVSRARELFIALRDAGVVLNFNDIRTPALNNNWPEAHATELAELGVRIGNGGRVVVAHPSGWGETTVAAIRREMNV